MSIKKEYIEVTHTVTESILVNETRHCDVCNGVIHKNDGYWEIITGHHDWGNDSHESIEHFDVCSEFCLMNKFSEYINKSGSNNNNTMYFEVEKV